MTIPSLLRALRIPTICLALGSLMAASSASAQTVKANDLPEVQIDRDADALRDEIRPRHKDVDVIDTILTFTNTEGAVRRVRCVAYDRSGTPVGRTQTLIPVNGVRYVLASDLSNGRDFIGHVVCNTIGNVLPSALLLGPEIENLNVSSNHLERLTKLRFPLVATY